MSYIRRFAAFVVLFFRKATPPPPAITEEWDRTKVSPTLEDVQALLTREDIRAAITEEQNCVARAYGSGRMDAAMAAAYRLARMAVS